MPTHHLPLEILVERSAGTLPEAIDVFAATHLVLCPTCRARADGLDAIGGSLLAEGPGGPHGDASPLLPAVLARIAEPVPAAAPPPGDPVIPAPLLRYTGPSASLPWRRRVLGFGRVDLPLRIEGRPMRLLRFPAGCTLPRHRHEAEELAMVLAGGYTDGGVEFLRGDVAAHEANEVHQPVVHRDADCWLLLAAPGRLIAEKLTGRLALWLVDG